MKLDPPCGNYSLSFVLSGSKTEIVENVVSFMYFYTYDLTRQIIVPNDYLYY